MFTLHETTRRSICRWGFVVCCALPTLAVLGWSVWIRRADHTLAHQAAIGAELGVDATLAAVTYPRPHVTRYTWLRFTDPLTKDLLAQIKSVDVERRAGKLVFSLSEPQISRLALERGWSVVDRKLRQSTRAGVSHWELQPCELVVHLTAGKVERWQEFEGSLDISADSSDAKLSFLPGPATSGQATTLDVTCERTASPATTWRMSTPSPLPCSLLTCCWPPAGRLGNKAVFQGSLRATETARGWDVTLGGPWQAWGAELELILGESFAQPINGALGVKFDEARFRDGRLEQATGSLIAGPGFVTPALIRAAKEHLGMSLVGREVGHNLHYQQLAVSFNVGAQGVTLLGGCQPAPPGTVLLASDGEHHVPLLTEPTGEPQPVSNLVRLLVPSAENLIPATREADAIARRLPIPATAEK